MRRKILTCVRQFAKELRNNQTAAEKELWKKIRNKQLQGYRFLRQYTIGRYIADFYCSELKVAIEVDGKIHQNIDRKEYDRIREEVIKMHGIRVIRFTNDEILSNLDIVLKRSLEYLTENLQRSTSSSP